MNILHKYPDGFYLEYENGEEEKINLPTKIEVCSDCGGKGKTLIDGLRGDVTEMIQEDSDFSEDYFSGRYDDVCRTCGGEKVENVIDYENLSDELKIAYDNYLEVEAEYKHELEMEY